jgi:sigma-E factor negative regulatory protein RseB
VALALLLPAVVLAQPGLEKADAKVAASLAQQGGASQASAEARTWFLRMQAAAARSNFTGSLVVSSGGVASSSRVTHYAVDGQVYEMLEAMDGRAHRVLRHNDRVHMLWPQTQAAVIEKRELLGAWSTTPLAVDAFALENYELRREGVARVAGREAVVLWLQPRDSLRYAQRFWADRETALMLRADVLVSAAASPKGPSAAAPAQSAPAALAWQVLESAAFSALELGVPPRPQDVLQAMQPPAGYRVTRPQQQVTTLDAQGWALARPVKGFRLAGSVLRGVDNAGKRSPVLHAVFSDGLALVSLFVETHDEQLHRGEAHNQQGATSSLSLRRGEHWFTVVGGVPLATLQLFAAALDRRSP